MFQSSLKSNLSFTVSYKTSQVKIVWPFGPELKTEMNTTWDSLSYLLFININFIYTLRAINVNRYWFQNLVLGFVWPEILFREHVSSTEKLFFSYIYLSRFYFAGTMNVIRISFCLSRFSVSVLEGIVTVCCVTRNRVGGTSDLVLEGVR